jgi:hypothetical protein
MLFYKRLLKHNTYFRAEILVVLNFVVLYKSNLATRMIIVSDNDFSKRLKRAARYTGQHCTGGVVVVTAGSSSCHFNLYITNKQ